MENTTAQVCPFVLSHLVFNDLVKCNALAVKNFTYNFDAFLYICKVSDIPTTLIFIRILFVSLQLITQALSKKKQHMNKQFSGVYVSD